MIFDQLYNKHFPIVTKTLTRKSILKPWVSDSLVRKIKIKGNLLKLSNKGIVNREIYNRFKNNLTTQLRQAKANYFDKEFDKCEGNVKKTWNMINKNIKTRSNNAKIDIREGDNLINSPELPNKFNNYFSNIADELVSKFSPEDNNFNNYLKNRVSNSFYLFNSTKMKL